MPKITTYNHVVTKVALTNQTISTNTTTNGATVDRYGFNSVSFTVLSGSVTDGSYAITVEDSEDGSSWAAAAAASVQGSMTVAATDDNEVNEIGYIGVKRYVRIKIVSTGVTTGGVFGAIAALGEPRRKPVTRS